MILKHIKNSLRQIGIIFSPKLRLYNLTTGKILLIISLIIATIFCLIDWNVNTGDATIYLVYAKNFSHGYLFQYNQGEFSSGATGPFWTLILGIVYLITGGSLFLIKLFFLFVYLLSFLALFLLVKIILKNDLAAGFATLIWAGFKFNSKFAMSGMETMPFILVSFLSFYFIARLLENHQYKISNLISACLYLGLLPLLRPEGFLITLLGAIILSYFFIRNRRFSAVVIIIILLVLILSPYYLILWIKQGNPLPFSGQARLLKAQEFNPNNYSLLPWRYTFLDSVVRMFSVLIIISGPIFFIKRGRTKSDKLIFILLFSTLLIFLFFTFFFPDSGEIRYIYPALAFLIPLGAFGLSFFVRQHNVFVPIVILFILIWTICGFHFTTLFFGKNARIPFDAICEKELAEWLNKNTEADSKILTYEVQIKYFLERYVYSLDGIIDGKIIPYLKKGNLEDFLLKFKPNYWIANEAVNYRPILNKTILNKVYNNTLNLDETYCQAKICFTLIRNRPTPNPHPSLAAYSKVYKLDYLK